MYASSVEELRFQVVVLDPKVERQVRGAVAFGDFEILDNDGVLYPKHGLRAFYDDLIMGRPFPLTLVTSALDTIGSLVAVTVFLYRDLAIHPATPNLVVSADLVDSYKHAGLAHIDRDMARFFVFLGEYLPSGLNRKEQESRLLSAVGWLREYLLNGALPALPHEPPVPRVIERGTNGFVVAETPGWKDMETSWVELFRQGFLRGVLFGTPREDRQVALVARKSAFLQFDLRRAAEIFNEAERSMGEAPGWESNELWLRTPPEGTLLLPTTILEVLLRV